MALSRWNAGAGVACLLIGTGGQLAQQLVSPLPAADAPVSEQVAAAAAHPTAMAWAAGLDVPLLLVIPAVLWLGWAAGGGRSVLAAVGTGLAFGGMLVATYLTAGDVVVRAAAGQHDRAAAVHLAKAYLGSSVVDGAVAGLLIGQTLGFLLLAIALLRARTVPAWSAVGLGLFPLVDIAAHEAGVSAVSTAAYLIALVSVLPVVALLVRSTSPAQAAAEPIGAAAS